MSGWLVAFTAAATKEGCETGTHQDTSKDLFFSLVCSREGMHEGKGAGGLQSVGRGIGQEKKAFAVGEGGVW
jgi:hypothetical protein